MCNIRIAAIRFLAFFMVIITVSGCSKDVQTEATSTRPKVTARRLSTEIWREKLEVPATVMPDATVNVIAKVPGRVKAVLVDEGREVTAGDLLVELDTRDLAIAVRAAEGQVQMAKAGLEAAQVQKDNLSKELARSDSLHKSGALSKGDFDKIEAAYKSACAQVEVARAQLQVALAALDTARKNLSDARVAAPLTGVVVKRMIDPGQETSPMSPTPLMVLASVDPVKVEANVPEAVLGRLRTGMDAEVVLDGLPTQAFRGTVELVGPTVDPVSKMVRIRVRVPNPRDETTGTRRITLGMSGIIRLVPDEGRYFVVPLNTVRREEPDGLVVLIVLPDSTITERKVRPLRREGLYFIASEGLAEGEFLVTAAPKEIQPGTAVEVIAQ